MASAPPLDQGGYYGQPQPPSYEETMTGPTPTYTHNMMPPPPDYGKMAQPPYPPPQGYNQMPPQTVHAAGPPPVVSVQTVYVQPGAVFGDFPVTVHCPTCAQMVRTRREHTAGVLTWISCVSLSVVGCLYGCCLIPFCVDSLKDVHHHCPNCNTLLGIHKRL